MLRAERAGELALRERRKVVSLAKLLVAVAAFEDDGVSTAIRPVLEPPE
jgi:hypothetical protein